MIIYLTQSDNDVLRKYVDEYNGDEPKLSLNLYLTSIEFNDEDETDVRLHCIGIEPHLDVAYNELEPGKPHTLELSKLQKDVITIIKNLIR